MKLSLREYHKSILFNQIQNNLVCTYNVMSQSRVLRKLFWKIEIKLICLFLVCQFNWLGWLQTRHRQLQSQGIRWFVLVKLGMNKQDLLDQVSRLREVQKNVRIAEALKIAQIAKKQKIGDSKILLQTVSAENKCQNIFFYFFTFSAYLNYFEL